MMRSFYDQNEFQSIYLKTYQHATYNKLGKPAEFKEPVAQTTVRKLNAWRTTNFCSCNGKSYHKAI